MKSGKIGGGLKLAAWLLAAVIVIGGIVIALKLNRDGPVQITLRPEEPLQGRIYVGGAVSNPGYYPLLPGDDIADVLAAAGGPVEGADLNDVRLLLPSDSESGAPQKVDLNRAEAWLLEALPGVGEARAQAIIAYRETHGPFRDIYELTRVPGFGETTFEAIRELITVAGVSPEQ
jgi:competence protein ComEA